MIYLYRGWWCCSLTKENWAHVMVQIQRGLFQRSKETNQNEGFVIEYGIAIAIVCKL